RYEDARISAKRPASPDAGRFSFGAIVDLARCRNGLAEFGTLSGLRRWIVRQQIGRRTVMRWWTIPILGAVAFSLTIPAPANARMRLGPGAIFGAFAGAMFGGLRSSTGHHRRSATTSERARTRDGAERARTRDSAERARARDSAERGRDSAPGSETRSI